MLSSLLSFWRTHCIPQRWLAPRKWTEATRVQLEVWFYPSGPSDVHIHWLINGHSLDTPITEHRQPLGQQEVLVSSWLREGPLIKDARYHCVAEASTGNVMSEVDLRLAVGGIWPGPAFVWLWEKQWDCCSSMRFAVCLLWPQWFV